MLSCPTVLHLGGRSKGLGEKGRGAALCKPLSLPRSSRGCSEDKPF